MRPADPGTIERMRNAHEHARTTLHLHAGHPTAGIWDAWGHNGRTLGQPVTHRRQPAWLRVAATTGDQIAPVFWDGALTAVTAIPSCVPRPRLCAVHDWTCGRWSYRAELYDYQPGRTIAAGRFPTTMPDLPAAWWAELRAALAHVADVPTRRMTISPQYIGAATQRHFGIAPPAPTIEWTTAHGDLHWAQLYAPLRIVDWEGWGLAPPGYDAATLFTHSLLHPPTATRIRHELPVLTTTAGWHAQLAAAAERLDTLPRDHPLAHALHRHIADGRRTRAACLNPRHQ